MKSVKLFNGLIIDYDGNYEICSKYIKKIQFLIEKYAFLFDKYKNNSNEIRIDVSELINNYEAFSEEIFEKESIFKLLSDHFNPPKECANFNSLFIEFLQYINAPIEWYNLYKHFSSNNKMVFKFSRYINNGKCDGNEILLISNGSLCSSFLIFVHEFCHYVSANQNINVNTLFTEFPSIYFENMAATFLKEKGYRNSSIDMFKKERYYELYLLTQLIDKIENNNVTNQIDYDFIANNFNENTIKTILDTFNNKLDSIEHDIRTHKIDKKEYSYFIGVALSIVALNNEDMDSVTEKIIEIANNMDNYSIVDVIDSFNDKNFALKRK